jgi:hypothetical protein
LTLSYNGAPVLSIPLYETGTFYEDAWYWIEEMGHCDGESQSGSGKDDSCFDSVVALRTDSEADEMALVMFDANDVDADGRTTPILPYDFGELVDSSSYDEEVSCLDTSGCYVVWLLDKGNDGFVSTGGLEVTVDGTIIMSVGPGDVGQYSSEIGAMWWAISFGNCDV